MKITFKNVGQGDSIIVESTEMDFSTGIIDCNKFNGENPVIQHLKDNKIENILFVVLSHPHYDHYSGLFELLDFCEKQKISIKYFAHTSIHHISYMQWFELEEDKVALLESIFLKIIELHGIGLIKNIGNISQNWTIPLNNIFKLISLSPSDDETREYYKQVKLLQNSNRKKCSAAANLLSTVFKITDDNNFILLTSDTEKSTFERLYKKCMDDYFDSNLILCQIPHHGSSKNDYPDFWKNLKYKQNNPAVISVGKNEKYNHPHIEVVESFDKMNYRIHSTNNVNGMSDFVEIKEIILSVNLSAHDELIEEYNVEGDKVFLIKDNCAELIS